MNRRHVLRLSAIAAFGTALQPRVALSQPKPLKEQLIGTWRSVSIIVTRKDGSRAQPFGKQPAGILILAADGHVALISTRPDAPKIASNNRLEGTPEEYQAIMRGTHALFGTYSVNEGAKSFSIKVLGGTFPNEIGGQSLRIVTAIGPEEFTYTYPAGAAVGAIAQATWRRAK
jgi:hypothetical protein